MPRWPAEATDGCDEAASCQRLSRPPGWARRRVDAFLRDPSGRFVPQLIWRLAYSPADDGRRGPRWSALTSGSGYSAHARAAAAAGVAVAERRSGLGLGAQRALSCPRGAAARRRAAASRRSSSLPLDWRKLAVHWRASGMRSSCKGCPLAAARPSARRLKRLRLWG